MYLLNFTKLPQFELHTLITRPAPLKKFWLIAAEELAGVLTQ